MSHVDLRGFVYSLEPVQRQREWQLEASLAKQRAIVSQLSQASTGRDELDRDAAELAARTRDGALVDLAAHLRLLGYLSNLQHRREGIVRRIDALRAELRLSSDEVQACQRNLDAIEEHRASERAEHGLARSRQLQAQVDDEWLMRARYRTPGEGTSEWH